MSDNKNTTNEAPKGGDLVMLTDDQGHEVRYEFLDMIKYGDVDYAVLVPEDGDEVEIFTITDADQDTNTLTPVASQETANAVFELFMTAHAEDYDFT